MIKRTDFFQDFEIFMSTIEERLETIGFALSTYPIDHICYRVTSESEFQSVTSLLKTLSVLYSEKIFNGRVFNIFFLKQALEYKDVKISIVETSQPGGSSNYSKGFQHIEVLTYDNWTNTKLEAEVKRILQEENEFPEKIHIKWEDDTVYKSTNQSILISALTEDNPQIVVL